MGEISLINTLVSELTIVQFMAVLTCVGFLIVTYGFIFKSIIDCLLSITNYLMKFLKKGRTKDADSI